MCIRDRNYASHFPDLTLRKIGDKYCWEFSLKVYNDTYDIENHEASKVSLKSNDIIGLSVAYCDNDDPNEIPKLRDNFFGSVFVTEEHYNDHWMNSDDYGILQLIGKPTSIKNNNHQSKTNFEIYQELQEWVRKWNYGVSVKIGSEFKFSKLVYGGIELNLAPDLSKQIFVPATIRRLNPFTHQPEPGYEQSTVNTTIELSFYLRFLQLIEYIE